MDAWEFLLTGWVQGLYGALRSQGIGGCLLAATAGWQLACWGLRLTGHGPAGRTHLSDVLQTAWGNAVVERVHAARSGRWPLKDRDPCPLETTIPGILAAGDIRAGSTKRVGFAVGDGSLAVTCAHRLRSLRA